MDAELEVVDGAVELVEGDRVLARGEVSPAERQCDLRIELFGDTDRAPAFGRLLPALLDLAAEGAAPSCSPRWWVIEPDGDSDRLAERHGLPHRRDLHQLRRPLPLDDAARGGQAPLETRPIALGTSDEAAVVAVNNRAFAWHPDQAGRTTHWLHGHATEPWFDSAGFLVHETEGIVDGFCWTKVHADVDPPVGEIFVIGVDPAAHGRGLGRGLTVAGLDYLAERGMAEAMLYVEATNAAALGLYEQLGFRRHQLSRAYQAGPALAAGDI